jgi:hypothetical protein
LCEPLCSARLTGEKWIAMITFRFAVAMLLLGLVGCTPYVSTTEAFKVRAIDMDTGQPVPYAVFSYGAVIAKGGGRIDNSAPKVERYGKNRFIFTDKNGEATVHAIGIVGLGNYSQGISDGFSSRYIFNLKGWEESNRLVAESTSLNPGSPHEKTLLMQRAENSSRLASSISSDFYFAIVKGKAELLDSQHDAFCAFIASLQRNDNLDLDEIFVGTEKSVFERSVKFDALLRSCANWRLKKE